MAENIALPSGPTNRSPKQSDPERLGSHHSMRGSSESAFYCIHSTWEYVSFQTSEDKEQETDENEHALLKGQTATRQPYNANWNILDLSRTKIMNIPTEIIRFSFLVELNLQKNFLQELAPEICMLANLRTLNISENMIKEFPPEICKLSKLRSLVAHDNMLRSFPAEMGALWRLESFSLDGNPLEEPLADLYATGGATEVIRFIRENIPVTIDPPERLWHYIDDSSRTEPPFTVLSYNVLGNTFTSSQIYGYVPSWALSWHRRCEMLVSDILGISADIVLLQEIEMQHYENFFLPRLEALGDYSGAYIQKTRSKTMHSHERQAVDGCATFYSKKKYNHLKTYHVELTQLALEKEGLRGCEDMYQRLQTRCNVSLIVLLRDKITGKEILCANIHLHWDPEYPDVKLMQTILFLEEFERIRLETKPDAFIIGGDFNSLPNSGVYSLLSTGHIEPTHPDFMGFSYEPYTSRGFNHNLKLASAYSCAQELPQTCFSDTFQGTIDYIWHSERKIVTSGLLGPLSQKYLGKTVGFPNIYFPSDHIPICAEFIIKQDGRKPTESLQKDGLVFKNQDASF